MKKQLILLVSILAILENNAYSSRRRALSSRGRGTQNINVSGTTTSIQATIADTIAEKTAYENIAPITDKQAERECTNMVVKALRKQCSGTNKCKNATETYAMLEFDDAKLEGTSLIPSSYRTTYCANFLETAVNKLWNSYDSALNLEEENCNIALAKAFAAEDCYLYVMTNQSTKVYIDPSELKGKCGVEGIKKQYKNITSTDLTNTSALNDDLANYFSKVGNIGFSDIMAYPGRALDLKIDFKTSAFPRELVQLVNTIKSQGNVMCGPDRYSELYDTNMPLEIKQSSWQKAVNEKGILKGSVDYFTDQISVFTGTDRMDEWKKDPFKAGQKTTKENKICQQEYEKQFSVEERASHPDKYKETWINDCIKEKKKKVEIDTPSQTQIQTVPAPIPPTE